MPKSGITAGCLKLVQCEIRTYKLCANYGKGTSLDIFVPHLFDTSIHEKINWNYILDLSDARIFFGRTALMAKALGTTPEEEQQPGLHQLARVCASNQPSTVRGSYIHSST